ncbi:phage holin family protein [Lutibaculum baratangense]|uniref:Nutrient deprivation-induced protein n=1 Tax=Lutibaculum baratangense AMV1 TaxID=631454 RepID=V4RSS7_9HYPH|nr:phage holin family protein [Lutibaculum baratangense]ESR26190.1 hypothetical protein N177_1049 [Lutibaculum baratangense AMV1]
MADTQGTAGAPRERVALHRLIGDTMRQSTDLVQLEIALFKEEMTENVTRLFVGLGLLVTGAIFAIVSLLLLVQAFVEWLATVLESESLAALITGGALLLIALALMLGGRSMMSLSKLRPSRTVRSVRRDTHMFTDRMSS